MVGSSRFAIVCATALGFAAGAPARAAEVADACLAGPTRACVFEAAVNAAVAVQEPGRRAIIYARIAASGQRAGLAGPASAALARATEDAKGASEPQAQVARVVIAIAEAEMGDAAPALATARALTEPMARGFALTGIAGAQQRLGEVNDAAANFAEAISAVRSGPEKNLDYNLIQIALAEAASGSESATATFDLALAAAKAKKSDAAQATVVDERARAGDFVAAYVDISEISGDLRSFSQQALAEAEAASGRLDDAANVARSISIDFVRAATLATVAVAELRGGRNLDAAELIVQAETIAKTETLPSLVAQDAAHVAGAEAAAKLASRAQAHLDAARAALDSETDPSDRNSLRAAIALALARAGRVREAIDVALGASADFGKLLASTAVADDQRAAGRADAAFAALLAIPMDSTRALDLAKFAEKLPH